MARKARAAGSSSLRDRAYDRLLIAIIVGELEGGAQLNEKDLIRTFGLGQAAVRDALFRLSLEGLVERQARIGTRVADLNFKALQEVFEARLAVETYTAALAAERATKADLAAIRATHKDHDAAAEARDVERLVRIDMAFHSAIWRAARNAELERTLQRLHSSAARFWCVGLARTSVENIKRQGQAHRDLVDAIEDKNFPEIERRIGAMMGYVPDQQFLLNEPTVSIKLFPDADARPQVGVRASPETTRAVTKRRTRKPAPDVAG